MAKKCFKVGYQMDDTYGKASNPYIRFGGNWLREFNIDVGDKLELISGKNMLVLMKVKD